MGVGNKELGAIAGGRGIVFEEQPDGTFARRVSAVLKTLGPIGAHTTDSSLATAKTIALPAGSNRVLIQATAQNVRYTLDGTTPTAAIGFVLTAGNDPIIIPFSSTTVLTVIEETAGGILNFQFVV